MAPDGAVIVWGWLTSLIVTEKSTSTLLTTRAGGRRDRQRQGQLAQQVVVRAGVDVDAGVLDRALHLIELGGGSVLRSAARRLLGDLLEVGDDLVDVGVAVDVDRVLPVDALVALVRDVGQPGLGVDPELLEDRGASWLPCSDLAFLADCS